MRSRVAAVDSGTLHPVHSALLEQALAYARKNLRVFPLWPRGKTPLTPRGVYDASVDLITIHQWWKRWPAANIGLAVPEGHVVIDVDSADALGRLRAEELVLPATARAKTSRGLHLWYSVSDASIKNAVGILPGIDIRSPNGGYVVAPPSRHPSGAMYRWDVALNRSNVAECPEWVLEKLKRSTVSRRGRSDKEWLESIQKPVNQGRRNQTLAQVAGLLYRYLPAPIATELAYCWAQVKLQPPLSMSEVTRTLDSIANLERRRRGDRS